jgi:hypothetical protein
MDKRPIQAQFSHIAHHLLNNELNNGKHIIELSEEANKCCGGNCCGNNEFFFDVDGDMPFNNKFKTEKEEHLRFSKNKNDLKYTVVYEVIRSAILHEIEKATKLDDVAYITEILHTCLGISDKRHQDIVNKRI